MNIERFLEYLAKEWAILSQAPFAFLILAAIMLWLGYWAAKWKFTAVIDKVKESNESLKERLHLRSEQAESYKGRALKYDEKIQQIVDSDAIALKGKTLEVVKNLREFIERHRREDNRISEIERSAMFSAKTEEDRNAAWEKNISEMMRLSNERNAEYERRFRVDAVMLRDELRSRLPNYKPLASHQDVMYEHPTNYFGFNDVAFDLERMAKMLR